MKLRSALCLLMLAQFCLTKEGEEGKEGTDYTFSDYVPLYSLTEDRTAAKEIGATKSLFYDFLPSELGGKKASVLEIRSVFSGDVRVIESAQFGISVDINSMNTFTLSSVEMEYTAVDDTVILQLKSEEAVIHGGLSSLITLAIVLGTLLALVLLITCGYLCFWKMKFEQPSKYDYALRTPSLGTSFDSVLTYSNIDSSDSLIKSWCDDQWNDDTSAQTDDKGDPQTKREPVSTVFADDDDLSQPTVGNGDAGRQSQLSSQSRGNNSSSDIVHSKPSSLGHRRQRYRASAHREISSSDDMSSIDDNWTKRKASWKRGHAYCKADTILEASEASSIALDPPRGQTTVARFSLQSGARRTQFADIDVTSGDGGFSSSNEFRRVRNRNRGARRRNPSLDELEWDEFETGERGLPPPAAGPNGWQHSTDDERTQENLWPPPLDELMLPSDDSDKDTMGNIQEVKEAIHSAMNSVNSVLTRDAKDFYHLVSCDAPTNREPPQALSPESPHDDGYETGFAVNGNPNLNSPPSSKLPGPPVAPKPSRNSGGGTSKFGTSRLPMTVVMSLTILSLAAGVYGVSNLTKATIIVFVPDHFFKEVNLYINDTSRINFDISRKPENTKVHLFDSSDPIMSDVTLNLCDKNIECEHGCNRKTGSCTCARGYMLFEDVKCTDKSDCLYLPCAHTESCTNTIGGFECTCTKSFWRDPTGTCVPCDGSSCPTGEYEVQGCPDRECRDCSKSCPKGKYITSPCTATADIICTDCSPPCKEDEYEYRPCTSFTNRKCNKISELPMAQGSGGTILESVTNRMVANSVNRLMDPPTKGQQFNTALIRGSSISVEVSVKSANLYPTLKAVEHKSSNDNEAFLENDGPVNIITTYCPYPIPLHYELLAIEHSNVTAAKVSDCPDCPINPRKPCATYKNFGTKAALHPHNKSMVCSSPDKLADMFNLNNYLSESSSMVVQPSEECAILKQTCDSCSRDCADDFIKERRANCTITSADDPNSWSPRLMYCQNCCLNKKCKSLCENIQRCKPVSCWRGNLAEFLLFTKFPEKKMKFYCNVELDQSVPLLSLKYTVLHNGTRLRDFNVSLYQDEITVKQKSFSDGLLTINYNTGIDSVPNLIHGNVDLASQTANFTSGSYTPVGEEASRVQVSRLNIMPKAPFSFSTKWWSDCLTNETLDDEEKNCSETIVDQILIGGADGKSMMRTQANVNVTHHVDSSYTLWNRTHQPAVSFSIPVSVSVIQKLYPPTKLDISKVSAMVSRVSIGWRLTVSGEVKTCPGYFLLKVWELEKKTPIADYEVAVGGKATSDTCSRQFSITFNVAGGDTQLVQRVFRVELIDKFDRRHFIMVESEKLANSLVQVDKPGEVSQPPETSTRTAFIIILPYLMVVAAAAVLISIAWIVSVIIPRDYGPVKSSPNARGILLVCYTLHRVVYILSTSLAIFAFIWYAMNGVDLVIVQHYSDAVDTVISEQQHDLRNLVDFSTQIVGRQREAFKSMRDECFTNIERLQNQSREHWQRLHADITLELSHLPLRNDLITALDNQARELKDRLEMYRKRYNDFARGSSTKLVQEISKTVEDFVKMDWLEAARMIRGAHGGRTQSHSEYIKGFQKWLGIRTQMNAIQTNFVMDPLPIAKIESLSLPPVPPTPEFKAVDLQSVFLPTHDLYSEIKQPQVARGDKYERSYGISLGSRLSMLTVLIILLLLDILTLPSRIAETMDTGQQILDGYVIEKTYDSTYQDGCSSESYIANKVVKKPNRVRYRMYKLIIGTNCIPLMIALIFVLGMTFASLMATLSFVSLDNLNDVGLFSSLVGPWNLTSNIALDNIKINRERTNMVDIPSTEAMMNSYIERIEILNNVYNNLSFYKWQIECGDNPSERCGEFETSWLIPPLNVKDINCTLEPVGDIKQLDIPSALTNIRVQKLILPYIEAFRRIAETTACLLLTYTSYLLVVNMLSVVLWNFLTRMAFIPGVRVRITNELPEKEEAANPKDSMDDIPTHMTFNRSTIEELSHEDDDDTLEHADTEGLTDDPHTMESKNDTEDKLEDVPNGDLPAFHY